MQTYFAKSIFVSKTFWVNVGSLIVGASELVEFTDLLTDKQLQIFTAVVALVNLALRLYTTRPVAFMAPGETKPVQVESLPISH